MHPTGRPLDAEFQPHTSHDTLPPSDGADMVIQDFNSFFEKLSGLDDVRWNDDSQGAHDHEDPASQSAPMQAQAQAQPRKPEAPKAAAPAPQPAPLKPAGKPAADAVAPAHMAGPAPAGKPAPARKAPLYVPPPATKPGLPLAFKLAMTALVLFAVGMGAGWLALSLPKATDRSQLAENPLIPLDSGPAQKPGAMPNPWDALKPDAAKADAAKAAASAAAKTSIHPTGPEVGKAPVANNLPPVNPVAPKEPEFSAITPAIAEAAAGKEEPDAFTEAKGAASKEAARMDAVPVAPAPQAVTVELPKSDIFASAMATVSAQQKAAPHAAPKTAPKMATAPRATPPGAPVAQAPASAGTSRYALQVGACSSAQCVDNYRKLIKPHVGSHPVEVVLQDTGNGSVQRVRVEPLTKDQAESLKVTLGQADARLKNAYVVKVADRS